MMKGQSSPGILCIAALLGITLLQPATMVSAQTPTTPRCPTAPITAQTSAAYFDQTLAQQIRFVQ